MHCGCQAEDCSVAALVLSMTTRLRRAIKIANRVEDQAGDRVIPVPSAGVEKLQALLRPGPTRFGHQFEDRTSAEKPARLRCAVQIPGLVEDQVSQGSASVFAIKTEPMQN